MFQTYTEHLNAEKHTQEISNKSGKVVINTKIDGFIKNISKISEKYVIFIYPEDYSYKFLMCQEIAKRSKRLYVLNNIFDEDDIMNIGMMSYLVYSSSISYPGDNYGGYKLFGRGLMFYAQCLQYDGKALTPVGYNYLAYFQGNQVRRDENPYVILESRKIIKMLLRRGYFENEYEIFVNLNKALLPYLQSIYMNAFNIIK